MLALISPAAIFAASTGMPTIPLLVYGSVTIDDQTASGGVVSVAGVTANIGSDGKYSISLPYENSGKVVVYEVNGITALATPEIAVSPSGKIDLAVTTPVVSAPAPAPSGGGTYIPPAPPTVPAAPTTPTSPTPQVLGEKISAAQAQLNQILIDATAVYS